MTILFKANTIIAIIGLFLVSTTTQAFLISDIDSNRVEMDELIGNNRWTVVMVWQLNCVPCELQKPAIEAFHNRHEKTKAHVVGLVLDGHKYMPQIKAFIDEKPTVFPSYVVFSDVFQQQIVEETGHNIYSAPGYLVYSPDGKLKGVIRHLIDVDDLVQRLESQLGT